MPATHDALLARITVNADIRFGKPCIRGHRITVQEILRWLSMAHPSSKSWRMIRNSNRMTSLPCTLTQRNWRRLASLGLPNRKID